MREVIGWPIRVWLALFTLGFAAVLSIGVALSDEMLLIAFSITAIAIFILGYRSRLVITATQEELRVGRAKIESKYIDSVEILDQEAMKFERGPGIDPRAFLAIRFWVKSGVKLKINDSRDPTPYWLISTDKPAELKEVLKKI
ncbi:MAG: DUF3093 domain-containing protein [Actinobacteria bacterium]|jgi:hypothetical protein|nr:DUF3093 domain-containing protein [Actinomycetota bacterium]NDA39093.1 DUF3093 domain-containing protein [Actinomycetota bacterium]NDE12271.1 DUF3093 domain-containing protein [Actinomycetota bacterium]NDE83139.1 DUF3093 domain-containing protein [Actinomycetota bacterium]